MEGKEEGGGFEKGEGKEENWDRCVVHSDMKTQ